MRRLLIFVLIAVFLATVVSAADVGVVIQLANGTVKQGCVQIETEDTADMALREFDSANTDITFQFTGSGSSTYLSTVNGIGADNATGKSWGFFHRNNDLDGYEASSEGLGVYEVEAGDIIGISYTDFACTSSTCTPNLAPPYVRFKDLCENLVLDSISFSSEGTDEEVKPGEAVSFTVEIENLLDDIDISDIIIEVYVEDGSGRSIEDDDGNDIEFEEDVGDLSGGDNYKFKANFTTPFDIKDNTKIYLKAKVEATISESDEEIKLENKSDAITVDKQSNDVIIYEAQLSKSEVSCSRNIVLTTDVRNIGTDEEDVEFSVTSERLGIEETETVTLSDDPDEDYYFTRSYNLKIKDNQENGPYQIQLVAKFDNGKKKATKTLDLVVFDCEETQPAQQQTQTTQQQTQQTTQQTQTTTQDSNQQTQPETVLQTISYTPQQKKESIFSNMVFWIVLGELVLIIAAILAVYYIFKRKRF